MDFFEKNFDRFTLDKIAFRTGLLSVLLRFGLLPDRADNYLYARTDFLEFDRGLRSVKIRHARVHQNQIDRILDNKFQTFLATI